MPDRLLDDDGAALIRYEGGAKGVLTASQIAVGVENGLNIRVYGEKGGLEWRLEEPNTMILRWPARPAEIFRTSYGYMSGSGRLYRGIREFVSEFRLGFAIDSGW